MSNYFGEDISKFLNSSQNPLIKLDSLISSIDYLMPQIQNFLLNLNISPDTFKFMNSSNYKVYTSLINTEIINSVSVNKGYNYITIQSIYPSFDIDLYINSIDQNIYYVYNNIYEIYINYNKDFNLYKSLCILYNNSPQEYTNYLLQYDAGFNPFNFIHNCKPYNLDYDFSNIAVFPFLYEYMFILKCYESCTDTKTKLSELIFKNNKYSKSLLKACFEQYIFLNKEQILETIIIYFCKNILSLGNSISNIFIDQIKNLLLSTFDTLINDFNNDIEIDKALNNITTSIVYDSSLQLYSYTALKYLHENIYNQSDNYFTFTNHFSYFIQEEDNIKKQILDWMSKNTEYLNSLIIISYKYNLTPLFFLNSFYASHVTVINTLVNNLSNLYNVDEYLSKINITSTNITNIKNFIGNNKIVFNSNIIKYTCTLYFKQLIFNFMESDTFINWLLKIFYPKLITSINSLYLTKLYDHKHIDILKILFNTIFLNDIKSNNFAPLYVNNMCEDFETAIDSVTYNVNNINDLFINSINSIFKDNLDFQNILSNFFRSSVVSKYLEGILKSYSI